MSRPRKVGLTVGVTFAVAILVAAVALAGFKPAVTYPVGSYPADTVIADFSGDGNADRAVSNWGDDSVSILRGNGKGAFGPAHDYPAGLRPLGLLVGDYNSDGRADLAVANYRPAGVTILLRTASGFSSRQYPTGSGSAQLASGMLTADKRPDLAVSNGGAWTVSILRGQADGEFTKIDDLYASAFPAGLAVSDMDRDGNQDVVVLDEAYSYQSRIAVFLGRGDGTFRPPPPINTWAGGFATEIVVGPFDGDSIPDVAVTDPRADTVNVLLGKGDGRFRARKEFAAGDAPSDLALGDFNHDGSADIAVSNSHGPGQISVLPRRPGFDFGGPNPHPVGDQPVGLAVGNLNGDRLPDIATANWTGTTSVLQGN